MNKIVLMGNLTKNPSLTYSKNGTAVCRFSIAVNQKFKTKEDVLFITVTAFGKNAENINTFFKKGSRILIEGRVSLNQWVNQNGEKLSRHEVILERFYFTGNKVENKSVQKSNTPQESLPDKTAAVKNTGYDSSDSIHVPDDEEIPF